METPRALLSTVRPSWRERRPAVWASAAWSRRREPHARSLVLAALLLAAALASFARIVEDYLTGDPIVRWDLDFARWLHEHSSPGVVSLFKVVTLAGNAVVLAALTAGALYLLLRRRQMHDAIFLAAVAFGVETLNALLKLAFHRPRPELAFIQLDTYSFPSGHAAGAAAIYGALAYLIARSAPPRRRVAWAAGAVVLVAAIGFSRLYLGAHYLSDVLAGFSFGAAWFAACLVVLLARRVP